MTKISSTDAHPYVDSWGNRYDTPDAPHSAPGELDHAPRTTTTYERAVIAWLADHLFILPVDKVTQADRYALTRRMFEVTGRPINPAVLALPHNEMVKTFTDYSRRVLGRYTDVEITETNYSDGTRVGYRTNTAGGGNYTPDMVHTITRDELKAHTKKWGK